MVNVPSFPAKIPPALPEPPGPLPPRLSSSRLPVIVRSGTSDVLLSANRPAPPPARLRVGAPSTIPARLPETTESVSMVSTFE